MTDQPDHICYARPFTARIPGQDDIHGVVFPSGRILAETPVGLTELRTVDVITEQHAGATIHWADQQPAGAATHATEEQQDAN